MGCGLPAGCRLTPRRTDRSVKAPRFVARCQFPLCSALSKGRTSSYSFLAELQPDRIYNFCKHKCMLTKPLKKTVALSEQLACLPRAWHCITVDSPLSIALYPGPQPLCWPWSLAKAKLCVNWFYYDLWTLSWCCKHLPGMCFQPFEKEMLFNLPSYPDFNGNTLMKICRINPFDVLLLARTTNPTIQFYVFGLKFYR